MTKIKDIASSENSALTPPTETPFDKEAFRQEIRQETLDEIRDTAEQVVNEDGTISLSLGKNKEIEFLLGEPRQETPPAPEEDLNPENV